MIIGSVNLLKDNAKLLTAVLQVDCQVVFDTTVSLPNICRHTASTTFDLVSLQVTYL